MPYWLYNTTKDDAEGPLTTLDEAERSLKSKHDKADWEIVPHGAKNHREFLMQYRVGKNKRAGLEAVMDMADKFLKDALPQTPSGKAVGRMIKDENIMPSLAGAFKEAMDARSGLTSPEGAAEKPLEERAPTATVVSFDKFKNKGRG